MCVMSFTDVVSAGKRESNKDDLRNSTGYRLPPMNPLALGEDELALNDHTLGNDLPTTSTSTPSTKLTLVILKPPIFKSAAIARDPFTNKYCG